MFNRFKAILIALILALVAAPVYSAVTVETIGGQNSSNEYHYTVDSDGVFYTTAGSAMRTSPDTEVVTSATDTVSTNDNGKTFILATTAGGTTMTLPDCSTTKLTYSFVSATATEHSIDTQNTLDTIKYLTLSAGDKIESASGIGDSVTLQCYTDGYWIPLNMVGSWTDGN